MFTLAGQRRMSKVTWRLKSRGSVWRSWTRNQLFVLRWGHRLVLASVPDQVPVPFMTAILALLVYFLPQQSHDVGPLRRLPVTSSRLPGDLCFLILGPDCAWFPAQQVFDLKPGPAEKQRHLFLNASDAFKFFLSRVSAWRTKTQWKPARTNQEEFQSQASWLACKLTFCWCF